MKKRAIFFTCLVLGLGALSGLLLRAEVAESPFPQLQFSADLVSTTVEGIKMQELYSDNGKIRLESTENGKSTVTIIRPDLQKFYFIVPGEKVVVDVPYDPSQFKNQVFAVTGAQGTYQQVGAETAEGVNCIKYKGTGGPDKATYFAWIDAATKVPVKLAREDGALVIVWKNLKVGPQDGSMFEPPVGYKTVTPTPSPNGAGH